MPLIHLYLAWLVVALVVVLGLVAGVGALRRSDAPPLYVGIRRFVLGLLGLQVLVGAVLLVIGHRPHDGLHLMYAALALAALPVAGALGRKSPRPALYEVGGAVVLLGIVFRLFGTGG